MRAGVLRQDVGDVAPGVGAARMHDASVGVAALTAEAVVERDPEPAQLRDPGRSLLGQEPHRAGPAEPASGRERVGGMERRIVARADGCGHASLGGVAVRARVRGLREHEHRRARVGRSQGGGEAGDPGSRDDDVRFLAF